MILIQTNARIVARKFGVTAKQLDKIGSNIVKRITISNANALKRTASQIAFSGELTNSIYPKYYPSGKMGQVIAIGQDNKITALELGPQAAGIPTQGISYNLATNSNPKLKAWADAKLGKKTGRLTIGKQPGTRFGKPSHKFITRAKIGMRQREERIVRDELNKLKLGGK
jgi:hypothetical protein